MKFLSALSPLAVMFFTQVFLRPEKSYDHQRVLLKQELIAVG